MKSRGNMIGQPLPGQVMNPAGKFYPGFLNSDWSSNENESLKLDRSSNESSWWSSWSNATNGSPKYNAR